MLCVYAIALYTSAFAYLLDKSLSFYTVHSSLKVVTEVVLLSYLSDGTFSAVEE